MKFQREGKKPIDRVTEAQVRRQLSYKRSGDCTFAILSKDESNFIQMYGGGSGCCLELRDDARQSFLRGYLDPSRMPFSGPTRLGSMTLRPDEFLHISQVTEAFVAYLNSSEFPPEIKFRDISAELRAVGISFKKD